MNKHIKIVRGWILFFMISLFISGVTAMPVERELAFLSRCFPQGSLIDDWIETVFRGVAQTNLHFPFIAYGYDWLAFAHFVLAVLFIGPFRDPVRNKWVIEFGMIACLMIIPFALVVGHVRGIPLWWQIIDCSFGIIGLIPLGICLARIATIEEENRVTTEFENSIQYKTI